jgi:DNA-binding LytR/AlgR family response regulator
MSNLTILIADDEVLMCEELQAQFELYQDIEIVAVCHDGDETLVKCRELKPDVVFLDIQMPGKTGLEVASVLARQVAPPLVVFLTAYADHAVKAFEVDAVDYVLKPFDEMDIQRVVSKLRRMQSGRAVEKSEKALTGGQAERVDCSRKFCVQHAGRFEVIDNDRIQFFVARDRLVFVQTVEGKQFLIKSTLNELELKLDQRHFLRCHRNYIVNINQVQQLENWFNRGYMLILKGDGKTEVPVSRLYVKRLKAFLEFE